MKKLQLFKTMLLLCALIAGSGTMWAAGTTGTINFGSATGSTKIEGATSSGTGTVTYTDGGNDSQSKTWTITTVTSSDKSFTHNASYSQIGSAKKPVTSITFTATIAASDVNVKSFSAKFGGFSDTAGTVTLKVGDTTVGTGSLNGASDVTVSNSEEQVGTILTVTVTGISKGVKAYYISYTYEAVSSGETTTTTIDASGITNTNKFVSTAAGSLSATVKDNSSVAIDGAAVTWSGNDDDVATINASTGEVTLVGAGTVTFTASYAGVTDTYQSSSDTYELTVTNEDPDLVTIWSEDFSSYDAEDVPAGGTYSYACTNGSGTTQIYTANVAGGTSPELLIGKSSGTFTATIPLLTATYGYSGDLTLKFKSNAYDIKVTSGTTGVTIDGEATEGAGVTFDTKDTHEVTFKGVTTSTENITIVFTATSGSNVRLDDIVLKGKQAELTVVATPSISPASGAIASGTEVTITCATDGATIYYTTNGDTPTSDSTPYDPENKPTITSACTIKAIGIKAGLTNSSMASASYTIAEPCATPTFSVAAGEVTKGTTVTISCDTDDATIYYTTNGSTPTTSSSVYSSAITINTAQTIKAIAVKDGYANSEVASVAYTVLDYVTLPYTWAGGTSSAIAAETGVTLSGLGSDYAAANAPYYLKMDGVGDYIQIKTNAQPVKVLIGIKMVGGATTSKIKVQESADGSSFTDVEELTISGASNAILNFITTNSFETTTRYVKIIKSVHGSNIGVGPIKITNFSGLDVTVTSAEYATYCNSTYAMDFSGTGITAYTATDNNTSVKLNEITSGQVPANTPVVLYKSGGGTVNVPVIASASSVGSNDLNVVGSGGLSDEDGVYVLANKSSTVGFYLWDKTKTLNEGKVYLKAAASAREFLGFLLDGETTNISDAKRLNDNRQKINDNCFDLQGRKVKQPGKGLYIINGRKVVIK